jgi:hypothetical protein
LGLESSLASRPLCLRRHSSRLGRRRLGLGRRLGTSMVVVIDNRVLT